MPSADSSWEVSLARLEGKLDAIIASNAALTVSVNGLDRRVRDVETSMATMKQQLAEIDSQKPAKTNWTAVASTIAACLAVGLVIADRLFK
ncbi:MAG: hypothetical protein IPK64_20315 [bacterium]|nr:hypothetical protein [bacterium]